MKTYLGVLIILLSGVVLTVLGLTLLGEGFWDEPQLSGEEWCEAMMVKPNSEWTDAETRSFAKTCLYESED